MNKFKKLTRSEMQKVTGGLKVSCHVRATCAVEVSGVGVLYGSCVSDGVQWCTCEKDYSGMKYYGDATQCRYTDPES